MNGEVMSKLEEAGDPIEDIKKSMKLLEDRGIYHPDDGKFKISKELWEYMFSDIKRLLPIKREDKTTLDTKD